MDIFWNDFPVFHIYEPIRSCHFDKSQPMSENLLFHVVLIPTFLSLDLLCFLHLNFVYQFGPFPLALFKLVSLNPILLPEKFPSLFCWTSGFRVNQPSIPLIDKGRNSSSAHRFWGCGPTQLYPFSVLMERTYSALWL